MYLVSMYLVGTNLKFLMRKQVTEFLVIFPVIPFSLPGFLRWGEMEKSKRN